MHADRTDVIDGLMMVFQLVDIVHARARRRFKRGLKRRPLGLIKKLRKAKKEALPNEKSTLR